jgi:alkylation response protein AidB-like acyl-CoA dehydrogenase
VVNDAPGGIEISASKAATATVVTLTAWRLILDVGSWDTRIGVLLMWYEYSGTTPLYRFPLVGIVASNLPPLLLAVARRAIEEVTALAQGKVPVAASTVLRERASARAKLAQAEAILRAGRMFLYDTLSETWAATIAGEPLSLRHKADVLLAMTHAVQSAVQAVELMYRMAGTSGVYTRSPLERYFRDVQVLRHHAFGAETRYETVGQVYLGLPPDFPVLAF